MSIDDSYFTIAKPSTGLYKERGSKFIAYAQPLNITDDVKEILQAIKKEHAQAAHHCYAFRKTIDPSNYRSSDDREPSGSAGKPILAAILSRNLTDVIVVVVRYFGGTLLGVPGLIHAYRSAADEALNNATIVTKTIKESIEITFPYHLINEIYQLLNLTESEIINQDFNDPCKMVISIRKNNLELLLNKLNNHRILSFNATWKKYIQN
jgi:uncharacterized YigZ family protein